MEQRITELEKKIAFQEDTIETLNQVIIELRGKVDALEKEAKLIKAHIISEGFAKKLEDEDPPPHY